MATKKELLAQAKAMDLESVNAGWSKSEIEAAIVAAQTPPQPPEPPMQPEAPPPAPAAPAAPTRPRYRCLAWCTLNDQRYQPYAEFEGTGPEVDRLVALGAVEKV